MEKGLHRRLLAFKGLAKARSGNFKERCRPLGSSRGAPNAAPQDRLLPEGFPGAGPSEDRSILSIHHGHASSLYQIEAIRWRSGFKEHRPFPKG